jgi:hypothetical protein
VRTLPGHGVLQCGLSEGPLEAAQGEVCEGVTALQSVRRFSQCDTQPCNGSGQRFDVIVLFLWFLIFETLYVECERRIN